MSPFRWSLVGGLVIGLMVGSIVVGGYFLFTPSAIRTSTTTSTVTQTITTNAPQPTTVTFTGHIFSLGLGTNPTGVRFISNSNQKSYGKLTDDIYSVDLPNFDTYTVKIDYSTTPAGGGTCTAGTLPVYVQTTPNQVLNWSC